MDKSKCGYEGSVALTCHSDRPDKTRTLYLLVRSGSWLTRIPVIRSIDRDMGMSEYLITEPVHEDIRYFSWKEANFYHSPCEATGLTVLQSFSINLSIIFIFTIKLYLHLKCVLKRNWIIWNWTVFDIETLPTLNWIVIYNCLNKLNSLKEICLSQLNYTYI